MTLTGSRLKSAAGSVVMPARMASPPGRGFPASDRVAGGGTLVREAVQRTAGWFGGQQAADGHWRGPLEGDSILESEYLLIRAWAGRLDHATVAGCAKRLVDLQLPDGGWAIYPGGPVDPSASVKAYLALKLVGHDPSADHMQRARRAIAAAGGPWAVNSFTRFYLALLGQMPYSACPAVPPEVVLLPRWFPVNLWRVSAWSRTMIVPLSLMWAFKPVRKVPLGRGIEELFAADQRTAPPPADTSWWAGFFRGTDRLIKACEAVGFVPLRRRAVQACRRWMLERFVDSDGLGAIFPPIVWSIVALRAMGAAPDAPEVEECWRQLDRLVEPGHAGTTRLEPCRSPVWDTAIALIAMVEAGEPVESATERAVDWLLDREIRTPGDWARGEWARRAADRGHAIEPSGWCFEYANRFYPDVDDTAMVLIALATWRDRSPPSAAAASGPESGRRRDRVAAAIRRGRAWMEAMQNADGGWGAFDRDNDSEFLCKVPFADHNAMIDPSSPDLAGRVLEAFGKSGLRRGHPAVDRAVAYLARTQESDGCWFGRWGVNYIYGTWQALQGLCAVGVAGDEPLVTRAVVWLEAHQQADGGWGETPESYADRGLAGTGPTTPSQTAWAVAGLLAAGCHESAAVRRGVEWLVSRQEPDGTWTEIEFTGTGFPKVFYLKYHYYPLAFPLLALSRFREAVA